MGILNKMGLSGSNADGVDCRTGEDGVKTCNTVKTNKNGDIIAQGSEINFMMDTARCKPVFVGNTRLMEGDEGKFNKVIAEDIKACRMGVKQGVNH